jgi:hypothetical protein
VSVVARAEQLAEELTDLEAPVPIRATNDVRDTVPPCLLVVPVPRRNYLDGTLSGSVEVTWTVVALANPPADLESARELELLVDHVAERLDVTTAEPAAYTIPGAETSVPAYLISITETASLEE